MDSKINKFETIAKWVHSESDEPISEIEWLLRTKYDGSEVKLLEDYGGVVKHMEGRKND